MAILAVLVSPVVTPIVITAVAMYFFYVTLGLVGSYWGLIVAHTALATPFVVVTVLAALSGLDRALPRAAAGLGAPPLTVFRRITMPIILPGLLSGALFAFVTSWDEVVVALFLAAPEQRTLPRQIFSGVREYASPAIAAVAVVLVVLSTLLMAAVELLRRRAARLAGGERT
jgi:putative spermidine/putrescine transport system permease protein